MKANMPGKGLSNTQTGHSSGVVNQGGSLQRGPRQEPPTRRQAIGKNLSGTQTQNSSTVVKQSGRG